MAKGHTPQLDMEMVGTFEKTCPSSLLVFVWIWLWLQRVFQDMQELVRQESPNPVRST